MVTSLEGVLKETHHSTTSRVFENERTEYDTELDCRRDKDMMYISAFHSPDAGFYSLAWHIMSNVFINTRHQINGQLFQ